MIPVVQNIDLECVQFPLILVQEYGLNLFRFGSGVELALKNLDTVKLSMSTSVNNIEKTEKGWKVSSIQHGEKNETHFDYLINATGFRTGTIDDMVGVSTERMVEFKASYISQWAEKETTLFPEIIFHGERGTPEGMGQFTPYPGGYFQLHGMTNDITLYPDGLSHSTNLSAQPKLDKHFIQKLDQQWAQEEIETRTKSAIEHLAKFIPTFQKATVASKPLFGAQQIPGTDPTLRVAEVSFPTERYARCEIVKVSSALDMVDAITKELVTLGYLEKGLSKQRDLNYLNSVTEEQIDTYAKQSAQKRSYPIELAQRNVALAIN